MSHFVKDQAERELVGPIIGGRAARLFGAHVVDGPEDHAGLGLRRRHGRVGSPVGTDRLLGQAEIEDLDAAIGADHDVGGLEIAVGDAGGVRGGHPVGNLHGDVEQLSHRQRPAFDEGRERLAGHQLGDDVGDAVLVRRCRTAREYWDG